MMSLKNNSSTESRREDLIFLKGLFIWCCCLLGLGAAAQKSEKPNFIVILVDDQGWNGLSIQMDQKNPESKSTVYQTPHIASLAHEGMRFSHAYAPASICAPSRASLLTGKSTARTGFHSNTKKAQTDRLLLTRESHYLNAKDTTIAEFLKTRGYHTAHFGKWHVDPEGKNISKSDYGPTAHGFDVSDGNNGNKQGNNNPSNDPKRTFSLAKKSINFINKQSGEKPFYLQVSFYAVHGNPAATPEKTALYATGKRTLNKIHFNGAMGAMTEDLDDGIGMILQVLQKKGLDNNTYIIYTSDNGFNNAYAYNTPLRGEKRSLYEGGNRVPFIVKGPGIKPGTQSDIPICLYDILPTIAGLSGGAGWLPKNIDGEDISSVLRGEKAAFNANRSLYFYFGEYEDRLLAYNRKKKLPYDKSDTIHPSGYLISGRWKLLVDMDQNRKFLYDLDEDIFESNPVQADHPKITEKLYQELIAYFKSVRLHYPVLNDQFNSPFIKGKSPDADADGQDDRWEMESYLMWDAKH
ncbi:sulfatase [Niabella insulamsoli]|uniref:sulfatase n=1 Tax=Niabella insulamsoli TaxID=3144874 RepID=UPI0031FBE0F8